MGGLSWWHWAIVLVVVVVLFGGRGKLSGIMGDAAKGIKAFKDGLKDEHHTETAENKGGALPRQQAEKEEARIDS